MANIIPEWYVWLIGVLLPILENFVINQKWHSAVKVLIALASSIVVGLGATYLSGKFDLQNILITIGTIFITAQLTYDSYWKENLK